MKEKTDFSKEKLENEKSPEEEQEKNFCEAVIELREKWYKKDAESNSKAREILPTLRHHNQIVRQYGERLIGIIKEQERINQAQALATRLAIILHDCGKLSAPILSHHLKGVERGSLILEELQKSKLEGIDLSETIDGGDEKITIKEKSLQAIERHMNHPYLIMKNGNNLFPKPIDLVDKIVFDADMLANIGFKNVAFRLTTEENVWEDKQKAEQKGISYFQEIFDNVVNDKEAGAVGLSEIMETEEGRKISKELIEQMRIIYQKLNFDEIQGQIKTQKMTINQMLSFLNQEIKKAGEGIEEVESFLM